MNTSIGYYPGCSLISSNKEYDLSLRRILKEIDFNLNELPDWNCCGASAAHSTNRLLSLALPFRNLALASANNITELLAPCPLCALTLLHTHQEVTRDEVIKKEVELTTNLKYSKPVKIINVIEIIQQLLDRLIAKVNTDRLKGFKIASYYGCLLVRPPKVMQFDNCENPQSMDKIVKSLGAQPVDWEFKTECCGGGFTVSNPEAVIELSKKILEDAQDNGAQAIVVACQMCQTNLDMRQSAIEAQTGMSFNMPIIYITQLIGLAMGIAPEELGLNLHFVSTESVVRHASGVMSHKQGAQHTTHNA